MYGIMIDELEWYKAMSTDARDCVNVCKRDGREMVPYDTLVSACKCCSRPRNNAQWFGLTRKRVTKIDVVQDARGYIRITLYVD